MPGHSDKRSRTRKGAGRNWDTMYCVGTIQTDVSPSGRAYRDPKWLRSFTNNCISNHYLNKQHTKCNVAEIL